MVEDNHTSHRQQNEETDPAEKGRPKDRIQKLITKLDDAREALQKVLDKLEPGEQGQHDQKEDKAGDQEEDAV